MSLWVEVREGAVEESERSEGDDVGLRVFVGRRQAVVSTNDVKADVAQLAERAVAMARVAPEDPFAGLADPGAARARYCRSRPARSRSSDRCAAGRARQRAEAAGLAVKGVTKSGGASASAGIGGMVLVTSRGFRGAYLNSGQSVSMTAIAGEGTAMERDYDYSSALHSADLEIAGEVGRTAGERTVERLNPRKVETKRVPVVFDGAWRARWSAISPARSTAPRSRARRASSRTGWASGCSRPASAWLMIRCANAACARGRSMPRGSATKRSQWSRTACSSRGFSTARPRASLSSRTTGHAQRGVSSTPSPGASNLHLSAGEEPARGADADIADGFYVTDLIGMGVNQVTGDYSRGASGFWIENGERGYPVSEVTIAGNLIDIFRELTPANDLEFRFGTNAPTVRVEGLTVAGR